MQLYVKFLIEVIVSAHIIPGITLFLYIVVGDNVAVSVALIIIVMAFNGASVVTSTGNPQDLAPNFAGTQIGIMNFFGSMPGFIIPAMVAEITKEKSELPEWIIIFGISGVLYIISGVVFILFGSVEIQPWNQKQDARPPSTT
ncbi:hypothetical protein HHI36_015407 [Cryptolaemus montrouzieri]|uniref:Uncharacterized protein n=1 Tax=Cryptolaemus montrouzieri TaxID=559131 RepID=A0ABD2N608_9CUCU